MKILLCIMLTLVSFSSSFAIERVICDHFKDGKLLEDQRIELVIPEGGGMTVDYGRIEYINSDGHIRGMTTSFFYRSSMEPYTMCIHMNGLWNSDYKNHDKYELCITPHDDMDLKLTGKTKKTAVRCYDAKLRE